MQPQDLITPLAPPGVPAPFWLVEALKVLGFSLHLVPMNLWYAGLLLAVGLHWFGCEQGKRCGARLIGQLPIWIAFGINFGIVPLLFIQVAYNRAFYPATILMAWHWLGVIVLLIPAYYGVYVYALGLGKGAPLRLWQRAAGWISAVLFISIGFIFANAFTLMTRVDAWSELYLKHNVDGAVTGTAWNTSDPTFWPRWLMVLGLAMGTTAAWAVVDSAWFASRESDDYRRWAARFARWLYVGAFLWTAVAGTCYMLLGWRPEIRQAMFSMPWAPLTAVTGAAMLAPLAWLWIRRRHSVSRGAAALVGLLQFLVLAVNAVSRQVVQNLELKPYLDVAAQPTNTQWSAVVVFLVLFVAGLAGVAWMVGQAAQAGEAEEYPV
jgi:hypothetical protein